MEDLIEEAERSGTETRKSVVRIKCKGQVHKRICRETILAVFRG